MVTKKQEINEFFSQPTIDVAQNLLGKLLVYEYEGNTLAGYITETEAYLGIEDQACHSFLGKRTPKVEAMYQAAGTIYVYTMHTHNMLNFVTEELDDPQAVLIRSVEPVTGIDIMAENRQKDGSQLTNGPGKLTKAFSITRGLNQQHLSNSQLCLDLANNQTPKKIMTSPRIGIPNKGEWTDKLLRYYVAGNPYVSGIRKRELLTNSWVI